MKVIGLIGGIASGKSAVAAEFARLGAVVLDADRAAHETLQSAEVKQVLSERWGSEILDTADEIDRSKIAAKVFSGTPESDKELEFLEQTLHPRIREQFSAEMTRLSQSGTEAAVIDAPLLLEAGWKGLCDAIVFVDSPREMRLQRALGRNWTEEQFSRREAAQMPIELKQRQATHIVVNREGLQDLKLGVREVWEAIFPDSKP